MRSIIIIMLIPFITGTWAAADQAMEKTEILELFERLCQRSTANWIGQGQIEAVHRFSDIVSGEMTETRETVVTDGDRFVWKMSVITCQGGTSSQTQDEFLQWNRDRTFLWDGQTYTMYFRPGNHAIVHEASTSPPVRVSGPLTAGHIPWGQGIFTYERLSQAQFSGVQIQQEDGLRIHLTVQPANRPRLHFVLDPGRDDAVISYTIIKSEDSKIVQRYANFQQWQGRWIPMNILIDRYENAQLHSSDSWEIISLDNNLPDEKMFVISLTDQALVEHHSSLLDKPVFYRHSNRREVESLLEKRFMTALNTGVQNCGTVAIEHVLSQFAKTASGSELELLVDSNSGDTSLYGMKQLIEQKGLSCLPVKTSIKGLEQYGNSQIILYLPQKQHFVVLDRIDNKNIWLIDLDRQTFYHCMDREVFDQQWAGIALIVSEEPILLFDNDVPVPDPVQKTIAGSADYSCSDLIQEYDVTFCTEASQGVCGGYYEMWYARYGCELDTSGGYCDGTGVVGSIYSDCIPDNADPDQCTTTGNYISRYMRACQP